MVHLFSNNKKPPAGGFLLLQVSLVGLDHLLDHLAADGAGFAGGEVAVVALLQIHAHFPWCPRSYKERKN